MHYKTVIMSLSNLQIFALNILKETNHTIVQNIDITELAPCSECNEKILTIKYEPFTVLTCGHIFHRKCVEKKFLLTQQNECPFSVCGKVVNPVVYERRFSQQSSQSSTSSIVRRMSNLNSEVIQEDEEMEDVDESVETPIENSPNLSSKKRVSDSTEKSSTKKVKKQVKDEESRILKRLIQELSTDIPRISEVKEREALQRESIRGNENRIFFDLYLKISNAEKQNDNARHELIRSYYYFGEEIEKRLTQYKDLPEHEARKKINNEVGDQLPKEISKPTIRKKTESARKIYDLFFRINDDKNQRMVYIQRIKTFTASSISKLSLDNIKYVASQVRKDTGT